MRKQERDLPESEREGSYGKGRLISQMPIPWSLEMFLDNLCLLSLQIKSGQCLYSSREVVCDLNNSGVWKIIFKNSFYLYPTRQRKTKEVSEVNFSPCKLCSFSLLALLQRVIARWMGLCGISVKTILIELYVSFSPHISFPLYFLFLPLSLILTVHWKWFTQATESHSASF